VSVRFKGSRAISEESSWWGRADWPQAALVSLSTIITAAAARSKSSLVYILRLNAISYVDAVNFQRSQLALCPVGNLLDNFLKTVLQMEADWACFTLLAKTITFDRMETLNCVA
jgi:hypothetical protein